jgi:hypothetical protein
MCETRSLILREERRLRVFENSVLGRVLGHKTWRKLHNKELHNVYSLLVLVGKREGNNPLGRTRRRRENLLTFSLHGAGYYLKI